MEDKQLNDLIESYISELMNIGFTRKQAIQTLIRWAEMSKYAN